ncbi:hypothetical protein M9458_054044 [Cirrhinus mrigala]|uniref:Tripartite motif-containing protein 16-like n=1 Tax=Cirrhinus mrigala TaxID=683832 RepID=A0ABD0MPD4_CIRMR
MAEARFSQDQLTCPVCLDLLKDPVTIQCGHSYCKSCITDCWDQEDQMRVYSCPQCRQTFSPRPALARNTMLAELVEKLKTTKLPADCYAGAGDVQCDVCTGRKYKAVKSCLMCLNSYCQNHLEQHESLFKGKRHNLTDATGRLQEMICQKHEKLLEVFCRTDQKCICVLCTMDEHKNHDTVSAAAQRTEKQKQLKETQKTFQQRIQQREKDLQQLREAVESHKRSAQTAVEDSERIFTELIRSIERSRSELIRLIRDQEKRAVSRAEGRLERLEQEINDLRRRDAELEQLSHTQDHIQFLQSFQSLSAPPESTDENDDPFSSVFSFDDLKKSIDQLRDKLEDFCKEVLKKISDRVTSTNIVLWTRNDFLQYSHQLTLDPNTVNKLLRLSERNRVIVNTGTDQSYPDHPERFDYHYQVLCRESVCGRCYWELEWSGDVGDPQFRLGLSTNRLLPGSLLLGSAQGHRHVSSSRLSHPTGSALVKHHFTIVLDFQDLWCAQSSGTSAARCWNFTLVSRSFDLIRSLCPSPGVTSVSLDQVSILDPPSMSSAMGHLHYIRLLGHSRISLAFHSFMVPYTISSLDSSSPVLHQPLVHLQGHPLITMAEARFSEDDFKCPVCLDLLKDPVTIQCGHSYCKSCITGCWDQEDQMRVYSCPQCRQTFSPRPALGKNTMLAELVEKLKKTKCPADCYAGSCLKGKRHKVTDATGRLQEMICQKHEKLLEVFCHTDQKCICVLCTITEHKNHDTVSAAAQRTEKQSFQSFSAPPESTAVNDNPFSSLFFFDGLRDSVHQLREKLEDFCKEELKKISDRVTFTYIVPRTRNDFLQCKSVRKQAEKLTECVHVLPVEDSHQLTLDLNTVNKYLRLSENNRVITHADTVQSYPDHPDRFDYWWQVLCKESVCRRCYWEIEWSGVVGVFISVSYKSISRKGSAYECFFGCNDQSWSLYCCSSFTYSFKHNNKWTDLPVKPISSRIGVFVDHSAGTLSFYSVSDTMSLIHTVQTTFTQPLYPGFTVFYGSSVKLCFLGSAPLRM